MRDNFSKRVLVIKDDGEYSSASDFDHDTLTLLAADHAGNDDHPEEHISTSDADHYQSLIAQCVLSTQMERVEQISDTYCFKQSVSSKDGRVA
jgi:hypothetical protein